MKSNTLSAMTKLRSTVIASVSEAISSIKIMYYVYILTNQKNTVLYTGITNNLEKRIEEHKNKIDPKSFTAKYNVHKLVFYETTTDILSAIAREKQIKAGSRAKKITLIENLNPSWEDLAYCISLSAKR